MVQYNIALIGFGGVNRALAQLVAERNDRWQMELGFTLNIVAVTDLHLGSVVSANGIDARMLIDTKFDKNDPDIFKNKFFVEKVDEIWNLVKEEAIKAQGKRG